MQGIYIIYLKQSMFQGDIVRRCSVFTNFLIRNVTSPVKYVLYFYIRTFRSTCSVPSTAVFVVP